MLVEYALAQLAARGATIQLVDLAALPAEPLLGRGATATVAEAIEAATRAGIIVAGAPGYRATYSGLLKGVFDLLPQDKNGRAACRGRVEISVVAVSLKKKKTKRTSR